MNGFLDQLAGKLETLGWSTQIKGEELVAKKTAILSKWFLGSRKVLQRVTIKADPAKRELTVNETATEVCLGIAPPSFVVTRSKQNGLDYTENRTDTGWGGGNLRYGEVQQEIQSFCASEGWTVQVRRI